MIISENPSQAIVKPPYSRNLLPASLNVFLAGMVIWWVILQFLPARDTLANYLFNFFGYGLAWFVGGAAALIRVRGWGGWQSRVGRAVTLVALGAILAGVGQVIWTFYNVVLQVEAPTPSWADVAWIAYYFPIWYGIFLLVKKIPITVYGSRVVLSVLFSTLVVVLILAVDWRSISGGGGANLVYVFYVIGDTALMLISLIALSIWGGSLGKFLLYIIVGMFLSAVADSIFLYRLNAGAYFNGDWSDLFWAISAFFVVKSLLTFSPITEAKAQVAPTAPERTTGGRY